jgi:protein gp37
VHIYPEKLARLLKKDFGVSALPGRVGGRPICFPVDMGDMFHPDVPTDFIIQAFETMAALPDVIFTVCTKRPERMIETLFGPPDYYLGGGDFIPNVWLGVTAENQEMADRRIPLLLDNWMGTTWVSVEPMLEEIDLGPWLQARPRRLDWVVVGGESGPNRRPFDVAWAETIYTLCQASGVPFFGKQGSGLLPGTPLLIGGKVAHQWPG